MMKILYNGFRHSPLGGFHFMLSIDYTQKLLNLQGVLVKKVTSVHSFTMIDIEMPVATHTCPHCGMHTSYIHDYRRQLIKDIPAFGQAVILNYRRRRYRCPHCGKCFSEQHPFCPTIPSHDKPLNCSYNQSAQMRMFFHFRC